MKYVYPAIIRHDLNDGVYYVNFPDIECCFTDGRNIYEALDMGEDVLNSMLMDYKERYDEEPPEPSDINKFKHADNEIVTLIKADTDAYAHEIRRVKIAEALKKINVSDLLIETASQALNEANAV